MTIYLDSDYRCHLTNDGSRRPVEIDAFDGKCAAYIEGYRFIPTGENWTRPDGAVFAGEMIAPAEDYARLEKAQRQYEQDEAVRWGGLDIPQEQDFTATRNYPAESFLAVQGQLYQVIHGIPNGGRIITGQNVKPITTQEYINIITEG